MVTPRAKVSGRSRGKGKGKVTWNPSVSSMTDTGSAREERVSRQITAGAPYDLSLYRPRDLGGYEMIHATEVRLRWDVPCQLMNTRRIHETSTPLIRQCSTTPIQTKRCMNQLRISWRHLRQKTEVVSKSAAVLQGYV
jgi:hypothetical protein